MYPVLLEITTNTVPRFPLYRMIISSSRFVESSSTIPTGLPLIQFENVNLNRSERLSPLLLTHLELSIQ